MSLAQILQASRKEKLFRGREKICSRNPDLRLRASESGLVKLREIREDTSQMFLSSSPKNTVACGQKLMVIKTVYSENSLFFLSISGLASYFIAFWNALDSSAKASPDLQPPPPNQRGGRDVCGYRLMRGREGLPQRLNFIVAACFFFLPFVLRRSSWREGAEISKR
jgi:hypothetical protein